MQVFGHRGAAGHVAENTLAGIRKAIELGAHWVEIDVQLVDGQLIVFHDDTLDRTTNGRGPLSAINFETLRSLDAGDGERVPTLAEVFEFIDARVGLNIELKGENVWRETLAAVESALAHNAKWQNRILLSSFHEHQTAELAAQAREGWLLGVLFEAESTVALQRAIEMNAWSLHPSRQQVERELVTRARANDIRVLCYTVNEASDIERMFELGVDGVFSDYPDRVLAYCGALEQGRSSQS